MRQQRRWPWDLWRIGRSPPVKALEETCRIIKPYVNQNSNLNRLERALSAFLSPRKPAAFLSKVLIQACKVEKVSYGGIEQIAKDNTEDVLIPRMEVTTSSKVS